MNSLSKDHSDSKIQSVVGKKISRPNGQLDVVRVLFKQTAEDLRRDIICMILNKPEQMRKKEYI